MGLRRRIFQILPTLRLWNARAIKKFGTACFSKEGFPQAFFSFTEVVRTSLETTYYFLVKTDPPN